MSDQTGAGNAALDTVIVFTTRMHELAELYKLGLDIGPYQHSPNHLGCRVGSVYLGFDQIDAAPAKHDTVSGPTIWFAVTDIEACFRRFVELGATVRYPPTKKPWGATLASLEDLDGNIFGLSAR